MANRKKQGWRYPSKLKKRNITCGYIYPDGVILWEEKRVGRGKYRVKVNVFHVFPVTIPNSVAIYAPTEESKYHTDRGTLHSIVVHDPTMLFDGLTNLHISVNSASEKQERLGLRANVCVAYRTLSGARHESQEWPFVSSTTHTRFVNYRSPCDHGYDRLSTERGSIESVKDWGKKDVIEWYREDN